MDIQQILKDNPILSTGLGLGGAGVLTYLIKDIPKKLFSLLKREASTELILTSMNLSFHEVLKYIQNEYKNKNFRKLKVSNGRWGYDDTVLSIGYGMHKIKYKNKNFFIDLVRDSSDKNSDRDKETLTIRILGRNRKIFDCFLKDIKNVDNDTNKIKVYRYVDCWEYIRDICKRNINSVFIKKENKNKLLKTLYDFIQKEDWYLKNGIPYQLGILLYGSPGTGKTSIIKAIASEINYPIYYISPTNLSKFENAASKIVDKCIIVIEDIDSSLIANSRKNNIDVEDSILSELQGIGLSGVLNALDGIFSSHGRILITTTNHIEKLDEALIRPGRIDLKVEIDYIDNEIFKEFILYYFPKSEIDFENVKIKDKISVAMLQNMLLEDKNDLEILKNITK